MGELVGLLESASDATTRIDYLTNKGNTLSLRPARVSSQGRESGAINADDSARPRIGTRKIGAALIAVGLSLVVGCSASVPPADDAPPANTQILTTATSSTTPPSSTTVSSTRTSTVDSIALAAASSAAAAAVESERVSAEHSAQALAAAAQVEADRVAAEAAAAAHAETDRVAAQAAAAAQAEADRVAAAAVKPPVAASSSVYFANCSAARAAGAAPVHRGDPGYSSKLDRDGDGVGCES
jgi:hypothetical protein